jgi:drug/metabolite transporter (DMT)-like permease
MQAQTRGSIEMTVAMVISGTIGWFVITSGEAAIDVVFWRCVFGAATLVGVCAYKGFLRRDAMMPLQWALAALGGIAVVLNWVLLFGAFPRASISIATCVYNTQPFMLVALSALLFKERITAAKLSWLALAFCGLALLVGANPASNPFTSEYLLGIAMALAAAFFYAAAAIIAKKLTGVTPVLIVLVQVVVGVAMLAPLARVSPPPGGLSTWGALATLGVVHTGVMFILLYRAIQKLPAHRVGALSFIYPLVAMIVDAVAFDQRLDVWQLAGAVASLVAAAGTTFSWSPFRKASGGVPRFSSD